MKTISLCRFLCLAVLAVCTSRLCAAEEQELIATLQSTASAPQKWAACEQLRLAGSAKAVPALAALLADERLSQGARHALEVLPYPEAGAALRDALSRTTGLLKAGVIDSLGWRKEPEAVPLLTPLLTDSNPELVAAAASALGRIGGPEAIATLSSAQNHVPPQAQPALLEALLKCAEYLTAAKDSAGGLTIYRDLYNDKYPLQIRLAAWRGLALTDSEHRTELMLKALTGTDRKLQQVALKLLRESSDKQVIQGCLAQWSSLPPESQLAVLQSEVRFGPEALPAVHVASRNADLQVRIAAWKALGELNDVASIPALATAAAQGEAAERDAARESLERLHGPGASDALLNQVEGAAVPEKAELLRALGQRGDAGAVSVLLKNAGVEARPVRVAALEALSRLAPAEATTSLLEMAAKSKSEADREAVLKALYAICEISPNKEETSLKIVESLGHFSTAERRQLLPLLAVLGSLDALVAAEAGARDSDPELAKESVRVLAQWPTAAPAVALLELARTSSEPTLKTMALRSAIQVTGQEPDLAKRLDLLQQALSGASRPEEKKQALGQIGQIPTPEALQLALANLNQPGLAEEASQAAISIAEKLAPANAGLADQAAERVLAQVKEGDLVRRAWALRRKPALSAPFIRDWLVCGPYRQAGAVGALAVFDVPFDPEKPDAKLQWKPAPSADHVNLGALFPGQENCAAYLRTSLISERDCPAMLLAGSDDGIKAWLNGKVVHSNNVDRGEVPDQDAVPIYLKHGTNELLVKITQGGGGWSACVKVVGPDFKPIPGLRVECPQSEPH